MFLVFSFDEGTWMNSYDISSWLWRIFWWLWGYLKKCRYWHHNGIQNQEMFSILFPNYEGTYENFRIIRLVMREHMKIFDIFSGGGGGGIATVLYEGGYKFNPTGKYHFVRFSIIFKSSSSRIVKILLKILELDFADN